MSLNCIEYNSVFKILTIVRFKDRFRYQLAGVLAGGWCTNLQLSLLRDTSQQLNEIEINGTTHRSYSMQSVIVFNFFLFVTLTEEIFVSQSCSWDRLNWMNRKTNRDFEELDNLKRYMSCSQS
jgi:hypothetical protein